MKGLRGYTLIRGHDLLRVRAPIPFENLVGLKKEEENKKNNP